jgi:RimJ/RimL family protein N-acetyltransferase
MTKPLKFETKRLIIRLPRKSDARWLFENYAQDADVTRFLSWKPHQKITDTEKFVNSIIQANRLVKTRFIYTITEKENPKVAIGMIDVVIMNHTAGFGWVLAKNFWNKGYMTEAVAPVMDYIFTLPEIFRIQAGFHPDNIGSGKVMKKLDMQFEGNYRRCEIFPNISAEPQNCIMFSKVK